VYDGDLPSGPDGNEMGVRGGNFVCLQAEKGRGGGNIWAVIQSCLRGADGWDGGEA